MNENEEEQTTEIEIKVEIVSDEDEPTSTADHNLEQSPTNDNKTFECDVCVERLLQSNVYIINT